MYSAVLTSTFDLEEECPPAAQPGTMVCSRSNPRLMLSRRRRSEAMWLARFCSSDSTSLIDFCFLEDDVPLDGAGSGCLFVLNECSGVRLFEYGK